MERTFTVKFTVDPDDLSEVHASLVGGGATTQRQLSDLIQLFMYDHEQGPQLAGSYTITEQTDGI